MWNNFYNNQELTLDVELTTYCNAKCPQCSRTNEKNNLEKKDWLPLIQVSIEKFKKWFSPSDLNNIQNMHFSGTYGDPGMCKDLYEIVEYIINESSCTVSINTNGSMRDELFWWKIGSIGNNRLKVIFDVDGINQEMHSFYRRNTNLQKVLENMQAVLDTPAAKHVTVLTVLFKHNQNYLEEIQEMCKNLGVKNFDYVEGNNFQNGNQYPFYDENGKKEILEQITKKEREQGLERLDRRVRDHRHKNIAKDYNNISCLALKQKNLKVSCTGLVSPCCYLSTPLEKMITYQKLNLPSYHITTSGIEGDIINPTMKDFIDNSNIFSLEYTSLKDIINNMWYTNTLKESWNSKEKVSYGCKKVCGKI